MALDNINLLSSSALSPNSDKILLYRSGGLEASTTLLSLTNSALTLSGVYLDPVNQRMGINNPNPTSTLDVSGTINGFTFAGSSGDRRIYTNSNYFFLVDNSGTTFQMQGGKFSTSQFDGTAKFNIRGTGSTSATSSLIVQNSSGNNTFRVLDNGFSFMSTGVSFQELKFYPQFSSISGGYGGSITFSNTSNDTIISDNRITLTSPPYSDSLAVGVSGIYAVVTSNAFSINSTTQGFLKPRMTTTQKNAIVTPAAGLEVFDTTLGRPCFFNGTSWITL